MATVSLQWTRNTDDISLIPHHYFIYGPHVTSEHTTQYIMKFVWDCYTLIIHFWSLVGFKPKSEPLSVYSFSGCFVLSLCSSLDLSLSLLSVSSSHAQNLMLFFSLASPFLFLSPHLCGSPSLTLFFPFLSSSLTW